MQSPFDPLLQYIRQYSFHSIAALYFLQYQESWLFGKALIRDPIQAHLISLIAMSATVHNSKQLTSWDHVETFLLNTAKASSKNYLYSIPPEKMPDNTPKSIENCYLHYCQFKKQAPDENLLKIHSALYLKKVMFQFGSLEDVRTDFLKLSLDSEDVNMQEVLTGAIGGIHYMKISVLEKYIATLLEGLKAYNKDIQFLCNKLFLQAELLTRDELSQYFSHPDQYYQAHKLAYIHMAPLLFDGWPFMLLYMKLREKITSTAALALPNKDQS